jgi:hypothetical protein
VRPCHVVGYRFAANLVADVFATTIHHRHVHGRGHGVFQVVNSLANRITSVYGQGDFAVVPKTFVMTLESWVKFRGTPSAACTVEIILRWKVKGTRVNTIGELDSNAEEGSVC